MNMRLSGRFLFVHTQKHIQKYALDFKSSGTHHDCWSLAVHGPVALSHLWLAAVIPHPTSISANRLPTYCTPLELFSSDARVKKSPEGEWYQRS